MRRLSFLVILSVLLWLILVGCGEASDTQPTMDEVIEEKTKDDYPLAKT